MGRGYTHTLENRGSTHTHSVKRDASATHTLSVEGFGVRHPVEAIGVDVACNLAGGQCRWGRREGGRDTCSGGEGHSGREGQGVKGLGGGKAIAVDVACT